MVREAEVMMSVVEIYQGRRAPAAGSSICKIGHAIPAAGVVSEILGDGLIVLWNAPDYVAS